MQIRSWLRLIVLGLLPAILMAVTIRSSALAKQCIDPITKKDIPCPPADGGGGGHKKPTPTPYPSYTPTSTITPTATITPSPTATPDAAAVVQADPGQPAPQASFDKKNLFGAIVIGSLLVILIALLMPGLRRGFGGSTKPSPDAPPPGMGSPGDGKDHRSFPELRKDQRQNLILLQGFFDAARQGQLGSFIESDEVRRFLQDAKRGIFGGNLPDGTPGSEIPGTGAQDPLDVLDGLFRGPAFGLGRIDHSGGGDPAQSRPAPDGVTVFPNGTRQTIHTDAETGDRTTIWTYTNGAIQTWTSHRDGSADGFLLNPDGSAVLVHVDDTGGSREMGAGMANGTYTQTALMRGANGEVVTVYSLHVNGARDLNPVRSVWRPPHHSPGEDGHEANNARNPLDNIDVLGPRSLWEMGESLRHPGSDTEQHDPNTGEGGRQITEAERERLGRIVPAAEQLDPNSGIDPLTGLHLDPNQMHHTHTEDDELDPNTGEQPLPGG